MEEKGSHRDPGCAKGEDCFFCHHSPDMVGGERPRKEYRESIKKTVQGAILQDEPQIQRGEITNINCLING